MDIDAPHKQGARYEKRLFLCGTLACRLTPDSFLGSSEDTHNRPRVKGVLPRRSFPWCPSLLVYSVVGTACRTDPHPHRVRDVFYRTVHQACRGRGGPITIAAHQGALRPPVASPQDRASVPAVHALLEFSRIRRPPARAATAAAAPTRCPPTSAPPPPAPRSGRDVCGPAGKTLGAARPAAPT